jgi:leucyl-tRNA synthetase
MTSRCLPQGMTRFSVSPIVVLAPEHHLVEKIITGSPREQEIRKFIAEVTRASEIERTSELTEKVGIATGAYAVNPMSGQDIPVWIANYVLPHYGTGAVMGVPAHDLRDLEFAKKYGLPVKTVIVPPKIKPNVRERPARHTKMRG